MISKLECIRGPSLLVYALLRSDGGLYAPRRITRARILGVIVIEEHGLDS